MDNSDKMIEAYISKLFEVQQARENQPLTEQELKEVALGAGMTEADWQAAQEVADAHNARAEGFLTYQNWTEAIKEYEQTLRIRPHHPQPLAGIAYAFKQRWQAKQQPQDRENALAYARKCLQVSPENAQSHMIVSKLANEQSLPPRKRRLKTQKLLLIFGLIAFGVCAWILFQNEEMTPATQVPKPMTVSKNIDQTATKGLPDGLVVVPSAKGYLQVAEVKSTFKTLFGNRTSHHATCSFKNTGQNAITELKIAVTWYHKNGSAIVQNNFYVLKSGDLPLSAGATKEYVIKQSFPQGTSQEAYQYYRVKVARITSN